MWCTLVYTESPRRCQPPSPGNLTAKDNVLSTCLKRTLVLPKRSNTMTDSELRIADWILLTSEARDFELRCQFFSVRLVTTIPLAFMCGMILDMWLESKTMRLREGGGCLCLSRQPLRPHWRPFRQWYRGKCRQRAKHWAPRLICRQSGILPYSKAGMLLLGIPDWLWRSGFWLSTDLTERLDMAKSKWFAACYLLGVAPRQYTRSAKSRLDQDLLGHNRKETGKLSWALAANGWTARVHYPSTEEQADTPWHLATLKRFSWRKLATRKRSCYFRKWAVKSRNPEEWCCSHRFPPQRKSQGTGRKPRLGTHPPPGQF